MKNLNETILRSHRIQFVISTSHVHLSFGYNISITSTQTRTSYEIQNCFNYNHVLIENEFCEVFHSGTRRAEWLIDSYRWLPHVSLGSRIL